MLYRDMMRSALGALPFGLHIDGRKKRDILRIFDTVFSTAGIRKIRLGDDVLRVDTSADVERILYYLPENVLRAARRSPLYRVIRDVFTVRSGVFVDVGANLGMYSLLAKSLGAGTLLFEPEPSHFSFLSRNEQCFGCIEQVALSDHNGRATLQIGDIQHSGASSLSSSESSIYCDSAEVTVSTFDSFITDSDVCDQNDIELIKIDVEGHEAKVVSGMTGYLASPGAAPVWCEVRGPESDRGANSYLEVIDLTAGYGYTPYTVSRKKIRPFEADQDIRQVFDLLMLDPTRHGHLLD